MVGLYSLERRMRSRRHFLKFTLALPALLDCGRRAMADQLLDDIGLVLRRPVPGGQPLAGNTAGDPLPGGVPMPSRKPGAPALRPLIVLDAGHGGQDPGAIGPSGTFEKTIALDLTLKIAQALQRAGLRVKLTRRSDVFLPLATRAAIAHQAKADLFVSIHADSAPNAEARGLSCYTLSETASDKLAGALATRENAVDLLPGVPRGVDPEVAAILFDLTRRHSLNASLAHKASIVEAVSKDLRLLDNPKRSANFAVLRVPDVPSVLIETGFLSNRSDERLLADPVARAKIADVLGVALAGAVQVA